MSVLILTMLKSLVCLCLPTLVYCFLTAFFCFVHFILAEAVDCNHRVIVWSMLGEYTWEPFEVLQPEVGEVKLNHLIINLLAGAINKIDQQGAITVSAFDSNLAHYEHYTAPMWATKKGTPNFSAYSKYVVC